MDYDKLSSMINKQSGVMGIIGTSSDMRDVIDAIEKGDEHAKLALAMYENRIKHFIGAYAALMGGVDLIIFTGGVGENQWQSRVKIGTDLAFLGIDFDVEANKGLRGTDKILTRPGSKVQVAVVTTDEELVIARDTFRLSK
jgi:acetate kinase